MHGVRRWFSRRLGYPPFIFGHGVRVRDALLRGPRLVEEKRRLCRTPREQLRQRQLEMLQRLLVHAGRTCPFYRQRFKEAGFDPDRFQSLDDLAGVPPVSKQDLRARRQEMVSETFDRRLLVPLVTGGSTGVPMELYTDREAWLHNKVTGTLDYEYAGWRPGAAFAWLWGAPFEVKATQTLIGTMAKFARYLALLNTFRLNDDVLADYHAQLTKFKPSVLLGYTSSLLALAGWLERRGVRPGYPTTSLLNAAEMLLPEQRRRLEQAYGAPMFDRYGTRDCGAVAMECDQHNGLHVNVIDLVVEPYGGTPGEPQEILVTNLNCCGMPLIRYRIGDMGVFTERACPCGRTTPLLERIVGRVTDTIHLADNSLLPGEFFVYLMLYFATPVAEFQVVQEEDRSLTMRIVRGEDYTPAHEERIREFTGKYTRGLPMRFEYPEEIERTVSGKLRPVISRIAERQARQPAG